jgi:hypothetical protein
LPSFKELTEMHDESIGYAIQSPQTRASPGPAYRRKSQEKQVDPKYAPPFRLMGHGTRLRASISGNGVRHRGNLTKLRGTLAATVKDDYQVRIG